MILLYHVSYRVSGAYNKSYRHNNSVILDPFCGSGATVYAARKIELRAYGLDTSSIAASIAQAKVASAKPDANLELATKLLASKPSAIIRIKVKLRRAGNSFIFYAINKLEQ